MEVEVKVSLLLGHSWDSTLWRKTGVYSCGFSKLMHSMRDGDFEVKFVLQFRMDFKESNNSASFPEWQKANRGSRLRS